MIKLKKLDGIFYKYRESDRLKADRKFFLGTDDAIEWAINKEMARKRRRKNRK